MKWNRVTVAIYVLVISFASAIAQQHPERETVCEEATEPTNLIYGAHTTGCTVSPPTDADSFRFWGSAGEFIRINLVATSPSWDPRLEIRDPDFIVIHDEFCSAGSSGCAFTVEPPVFSIHPSLTLPKTGFYYLFVSDAGTNNAGGYALDLERIPPTYCPSSLGYNTSSSDGISTPADVDFYTFLARAGTLVRLSLLATSPSWEPRLEIRNPAGSVIHEQSCSSGCCGCSFSVDKAITSTGLYSVSISDVGINNVGGYQMGLQCLIPPCPVDYYIQNLKFEANPRDLETIVWDVVPDGLATYDLVKGDLNALRTAGGNFGVAITACIGSGLLDAMGLDSDNPAAGAGFFYLARAVDGDGFAWPYDLPDPSQVYGRDLKINASPNKCP